MRQRSALDIDNDRWINRHPVWALLGLVAAMGLGWYTAWKLFVWLVHVAIRS